MGFQYNDKSDIPGLLDMVRRGCERLYSLNVCTGAERERRSPVHRYAKMTNTQKDEAILLAKAGKHTATEIAQIIGHTQSATHQLLVARLGFTLRDGRHDKRKNSVKGKKPTPWKFSKFKLISKKTKQRALRINRAARNARKQTLNLPPK